VDATVGGGGGGVVLEAGLMGIVKVVGKVGGEGVGEVQS
jgi:hypothetical protein